MALTANREVPFYTTPELIELGVDDNIRVYKGALIGRNRSTGFVRGLVAGDEFVGVAYSEADNTVSGHSAGGVNVVLHQNIDIVHALAGVAQGDIGKDVYASDDSTLTLNPSGNTRVGRVVTVEAADTARVRCQPVQSISGALENQEIVALADASVALTLNHVNRILLIGNSVGRTLTLPAVATVRAGGWITVVKTSAAAAAVTLDPNAAETIDGAATLATLDAQYDVATIVCTGSEWIVLNRDIA